MVTFTANKALGLPAVGGDTGVWGPPLNNNSSVIDASFGGTVVISLSSVSGAITLLSSNYNNVFLSFVGSLTQNTVVTLPAIGSFYTVQNLTGNVFTLQISCAGGGEVIGCPWRNPTDIMTDGTNVRFRSLHQVGSYWDYAGSSMPNWVSGCTLPPYLNCDGSAFSGVTYPYLAAILGGTTLPDSRGLVRAALNQGTGRLTVPINGDVARSIGGDQLLQVHSHGVNDPTHFHNIQAGGSATTGGGQGTGSGPIQSNPATTANLTGISIQNTGGGGSQNVQPTYIGGLTLIRAG